MSDKCTCGPAPVMHDGCSFCVTRRRLASWKRLTPAERAYDKYVDPAGAYSTDFNSGCYCHISPPCHNCVNKPIEPEEDHTPPPGVPMSEYENKRGKMEGTPCTALEAIASVYLNLPAHTTDQQAADALKKCVEDRDAAQAIVLAAQSAGFVTGEGVVAQVSRDGHVLSGNGPWCLWYVIGKEIESGQFMRGTDTQTALYADEECARFALLYPDKAASPSQVGRGEGV